MNAVLAFGAGGLATWLLRICFVALVPADRMPQLFQRMLGHLGPAVMSTLVVTSLAANGGLRAVVEPSGRHLALIAAGLVAWRWRNVALPIGAAVAVAWLVG